jgi:hypothetical protein
MNKKIEFHHVLVSLGVVAAIATVVKYLSPKQRCPECDRIIGFVNALQSLCPFCGELA